jgi:hypothetical protein
MPFSEMPSWLDRIITGSGTTTAAIAGAAVGRLMFHVKAVQMGRRKFFSLHLLWEWPTAIGMALIGDGFAEWLGVAGKPATALIATLAYFGPHGLEMIARRWTARRNCEEENQNG